MRRVLHVGPCDTPGGMATVMHTLAQFPPDGWEADLVASHAPGSLWTKWRAYRRARSELQRRCTNVHSRPSVVHVHAASDWSLRRKFRLIRLVRRFSVPVVLHLHSGKLAAWMGTANTPRAKRHRATVARLGVTQAVLSDAWQRVLTPLVGPTEAVVNPVPPRYVPGQRARDAEHLLVLGRNDPVKGHAFAEQVGARLTEGRPNLRLTLTGKDRSSLPFVQALGWVSEATKLELLQSATVLLVPSSVEGQPLVVLEAMACGLPVVVAQDLHSLPSGVVRAGPSVEDWARAVEGVLSGSTAIEVDLEAHRVDRVAQEWGRLYASLLKD
jgi:glycosyltransferase involved in cell wall biosynthesis